MKKYIASFLVTSCLLFVFSVSITPVFAQNTLPGNNFDNTLPGNNTCPNSDSRLCNPIKVDSVKALVATVLDAIVKIGSVFLVLAFIWVGFLFVKARGNPTEIESARHAFYYTVVGGLVLLGANVIATALVGTVTSLTQ